MSKHWLNSSCLLVHAVCRHTINFKKSYAFELKSEDVLISDLKMSVLSLVCKISVLYKPSLTANVLYGRRLTKGVN